MFVWEPVTLVWLEVTHVVEAAPLWKVACIVCLIVD